MNAESRQEYCHDCDEPLSHRGQQPQAVGRTPCPKCGATRRKGALTVHDHMSMTDTVEVTLIISWQEVDRLLDKKEYAAALLVAAVNLEFILWETLRRLSPASTPCEKSHHSAWRTWQKVKKPDRDSVGLGSLIELTRFFAASSQLALSPPLNPFGWDLNEARKGIAHERGYFAKLTRLEDPEWPEARIRHVLTAAKAFCQGNAA